MARRALGLLAAGLIAAFAAADAEAIEIASRTGDLGAVNVNAGHAIQFTTSDIFENVSMEALVSSNSFDLPGSGTIYLTTSFGPGTTVADEIAKVSLSGIGYAGFNTSFTLLFSGLTLSPDTYYLILASDTGSPGLGWGVGNASATTTAAAGVMIGPDLLSNGALAPYAPATSTFSVPGSSLFRVSGDPVAVPEPSTLALMSLGGILVLAAGRHRRRDRSPSSR